LRLYATDDVMSDHAGRSTSEDSPFLSEFKARDMDQRWVHRSPETMVETFHWFRGEGFALIVEDLLRLPKEPGVIVEGFRLSPYLVKPLLAVPGQGRPDSADARLPAVRVRQPGLAVGDRAEDQRPGEGARQPARA
jgi:hypothetical protein